MSAETKDCVDVERAWIQTNSGGKFHILDRRPNEILITDIGHALGMICRFTGHVRRFYSVAEHCVLGSYLVPKEDAMWFLLHDASEAYITDLNRPLKHYTAIGPVYEPIEQMVMIAIGKKFGLSPVEPVTIKQIDNAMLFAEKDQLLVPLEWDAKWGNIKSAKIHVRCWPPEVAETEFLHRYYELAGLL